MKKLFIIIIFSIIISACNKLESGYVIEKWYEPTNSYVALIPIRISNGKSFSTILIPYRITDYEDFVVKIKGQHNGKDKIETIYINRSQYERLVIGSYMKITDECSNTDKNNHRERK